MSLTFSLIQFEVRTHLPFSVNAKRVVSCIHKAKKAKANLVCFPEDFWLGPFDYYPKNSWAFLATTVKNKILQFMSAQAKKYQLTIIAGTLIEKIKTNYFNTCFVFNPQGRIITKYQKRKLVPYGFEGKYITPGKIPLQPFSVNKIKVGIIICRELFFPELAAYLRKKGVEIVFCPSFWPKRSGDFQKNNLKNKLNILSEMKVVDALCAARSFENEICFCFVNAAGKLKNSADFDILLGRSQICYPFIGAIQKLNLNKQGMINHLYNKSLIEDARKAYQLFTN